MSQCQRIRELFYRQPNEWIPLTIFLDMRISQYGARIMELRRSGMVILNKTKRVGHETHSWFKYVPADEAGQQEMFNEVYPR